MSHSDSSNAAPLNAVELRYAISTVQGRRPQNEDRYACQHPYIHPQYPLDASSSLFAVFDGHGGDECADFVSRNFPTYLSAASINSIAVTGSNTSPNHSISAESCIGKHNWDKMNSLIRAFTLCDSAILSQNYITDKNTDNSDKLSVDEKQSEHSIVPPKLEKDYTAAHASRIADSGTTASCVLVDTTHIYAANCGDTKTYLVRRGQAFPLSNEHKPLDDNEKRRIERNPNAKVTIFEPPPVKKKATTIPPKNPTLQDGNSATTTATTTAAQSSLVQSYVELGDKGLAVSRAFGNRSFKADSTMSADEQCVIVHPYHTKTVRAQEDEFLIIASDGLWNFVGLNSIISFIRDRLRSEDEEERNVENIAHRLTQLALDRKSNDNVTLILVAFPFVDSPQFRNEGRGDKNNEEKAL